MDDELNTLLSILEKCEKRNAPTLFLIVVTVLFFRIVQICLVLAFGTIAKLIEASKPLVEKSVELVTLVLHHNLTELLVLSILYVILQITTNL